MTVETFAIPGVYNWICPAGVTSVRVQCWGGGGAGGISDHTAPGDFTSGGGGGGGGYSEATLPVTPGNSYSLIVGLGAANSNQSGQPSNFEGDVVANEGSGAMPNGIGGAGGLVGVGTTSYPGGNGATRTYQQVGGGGGGASGAPGGAGPSGSGINPGVALPDGGDGSPGGIGPAPPPAGSPPGGGGGGGDGDVATTNGGPGGSGQVILTYQPSLTCGGNNIRAARGAVTSSHPIF